MEQTVWAVVVAIVVTNVVGFVGATLFVKVHRVWKRRRG
jgi:hypothetical protein